jgi:hypothetical protein
MTRWSVPRSGLADIARRHWHVRLVPIVSSNSEFRCRLGRARLLHFCRILLGRLVVEWHAIRPSRKSVPRRLRESQRTGQMTNGETGR